MVPAELPINCAQSSRYRADNDYDEIGVSISQLS